MSIFEKSTLLISARSPFARRVRIAFLEHGVEFKETVLNVFEDNPVLNKHNPLKKVPTLLMQDGSEIIDSNSMLQAFYEFNKSSPLLPHDPIEKIGYFYWMGLAYGLTEELVKSFIETTKPEALRDISVIEDFKVTAAECLTKLEKHLQNKKYILDNQFSQADVDWGTTLAYNQIRFPVDLKNLYPKCDAYLAHLNERESFIKTQPPKA